MRRRSFITLAGVVAASRPLATLAQRSPMPVIGFVHPGSPERERRQADAFKRALNEAGYAEGQNVAVEYRWAGGQFNRVPALLADLVHRQVAVIVAGGGTALAAKAATSTIPVVFTSGVDPVQQGIVASLNRPGGNLTGVAFFSTALGPKQLELLLEVVPTAKRFGFVNNADYPYARSRIAELEEAAHTLNRAMVVQNIAREADIEAAFIALGQQRVDALIVSSDPLFNEWRQKLAAVAARLALPACYGLREFAVEGGLMSYGANVPDAYHQAGLYAVRILKGEKPADLPVVQAVKIELVLNLKTAKTLGLSFPLPLLGRADEVIE